MTSVLESVATTIATIWMNKINREVNYFRDFEDHVRNFESEHNNLVAKRDKVLKDIEDARRNEKHIEDDVQNWIKEVDILIQEHTKIKQTWSYGWCPYWQYRQGKMLAQRMPTIKSYIDKCYFERVARAAELPGIKYHASRDFLDFESRKTKFKQLVEALEDGSHYIVGLHGMGGTGKTTLATQVGKQVEESKSFEKVIFVVVSNPPDVNKIRGDIARQLGLKLEEREEAEHSKLLWSRISNDGKKLLIILDDVWGELNLTDIGIPVDQKNCYILITTRHSKVCQDMRCQKIVHLLTLADEDALKLFLFHATSDDHHSSHSNLDGLAKSFVKECGGLPVAIVALARTLRNWPISEWNVALTTLQTSMPFVDVDKELVKVYRCLRLSYDNLNDEEARKLFLLCSIFPEDYEIPISLFIRLGIGSGIFDKVDEYCAARSRALDVKNNLIASSLLLNVEEKKCVKMHDLVREVAQWIAKEDIQVITNSSIMNLKANYKRFVFWSGNDFPDHFDATKLEVLLLWISGNVLVKDPKAFFAGLSRLKFLFLFGEHERRLPSPSLSQSLLSLYHIQTLILDGWEIGDISVLKNLQSLMTLELKKCLIFELPRAIVELKKLIWLGLRKCEIQKNNPFEVIERCLQLKELYFVRNHHVKDWKGENDTEMKDEIAPDISPLQLQMYSIACSGFKRFTDDDNGMLTCFKPENMKHLLSKFMFKYLAGRSQVLELGKIGQTGWKSLVPDIIPIEVEGMNNLIKLYLYEWADIECLIDNSKNLYSNITVLSDLVELHLDDVDINELYRGGMPSRFLTQLQVLKLEKCMKLQNIFLDGNLKLPHLKVFEMRDCPMFQTSIFQYSFARSLVQLETLVIEDCLELRSSIVNESLEEEMTVVGSQRSHDVLFPMLKSLQIKRCDKLEMVSSLLLAGDLPQLKDLCIMSCEKLKYVFGDYRDVGPILQQEIILPLLAEVELEGVRSFINMFRDCKKRMLRPPQVLNEASKKKNENSKTSAFSWAYGCCFLAPTKDINNGVFNATLDDHTISQESRASSSKMIETFQTAECLMRQPLGLKNIRKLRLYLCSNLKSLFIVSIATTIMLEELRISHCEELKHIITTNEDDDANLLNCTSIFPKLQSLDVFECNKLEFIFPSTLSGGLQKLKSIYIFGVDELKYIFGKDDPNEYENDEHHIHLPALESLSLEHVPNMISIGVKKYQQKWPSLHNMEAPKEIIKQMQDVTSERGNESEIEEIVHVETPFTLTVPFLYFLHFHNLKQISIWRNKRLKTLFSISDYRNLPQLSELYISRCEELVSVVEDDSIDLHHMNSSSVFPKLEVLFIYHCNKMEFIFPSSLCGTLQKLKSLSIKEAAVLNYIFCNESEQLPISLPAALERISFVGIPKIINKIFARKYQLNFSHLHSIELGDLQEFNGNSFLDLMAYLRGIQLNAKAPEDLMKMMKAVQKLTKLGVRDSKIEEVLNLEGAEIGGPVTLSLERMWLENLSEMRHIYKGPKYIVSLHNLHFLNIIACKKLREIFCGSIEKSLPQLNLLKIEDCDKLVEIIEDSDDDHLHQLCFPKLRQIHIKRCISLKCLCSILTHVTFPRLWWLEIEEASELEKVFIHKENDTENMVASDVFPVLSILELRKLPKLAAICEGVDFQTVPSLKVEDCPKYEEITGPSNMASKGQAAIEEQLSVNSNNSQAMTYKGETSGSSNLVEELEGEHKTSESTTQVHQEDIGETNATEASQETNIPLDDNSIEAVSLQSASSTLITQRIKEVTESSVKENYAAENARNGSAQKLKYEQSTSEATSIGDSQSVPSTLLIVGQPMTEQNLSCIENIPEDTTPMIANTDTPSIHPQIQDSQSHPLAQFANIKETHEEGSQADDATEEATIAIPSINSESMKNVRISSIIAQRSEETEKEDVRIHASQPSIAPTLTNSESIKNIMEQGIEVNYEKNDDMTTSGSANSDSKKQSTRPNDTALIVKGTGNQSSVLEEHELEKPIKAIIPQVIPSLHHQSKIVEAVVTAVGSTYSDSRKQFAGPIRIVTKEARDSSVEEEHKLEDPTKVENVPNVIPSLHHQTQSGDAAGPSAISRICDIFQNVELNDGEMALLAQALKQYPQLLLPHHEHLTNRIIGFSYRVLVDILVMLATKSPYTITPSEKSTFESNLREAAFVGFDKNWIDSVRARVLGADMSDVLAAEEELQIMEAELETCDIALEQVRKQRVEAKERLAVTRRHLEMSQIEFEAIDSQLSGLLEDREKLIAKMTEFRGIISAKDRPFGI